MEGVEESPDNTSRASWAIRCVGNRRLILNIRYIHSSGAMADRTAEFLSLCQEAKEIRERYRNQVTMLSKVCRCILWKDVQVGAAAVGSQLNKPLRAKPTPAEAAAFTQAASTISKDIHRTAQKLGRLTKRKGLSNCYLLRCYRVTFFSHIISRLLPLQSSRKIPFSMILHQKSTQWYLISNKTLPNLTIN